jgi:hypothetical protein
MLLGRLFGGSDHQAPGKPGININGYVRSLLPRAAGRDDDEPPLLRTLLKLTVGEITKAPARDGALLSSLAEPSALRAETRQMDPGTWLTRWEQWMQGLVPGIQGF